MHGVLPGASSRSWFTLCRIVSRSHFCRSGIVRKFCGRSCSKLLVLQPAGMVKQNVLYCSVWAGAGSQSESCVMRPMPIGTKARVSLTQAGECAPLKVLLLGKCLVEGAFDVVVGLWPRTGPHVEPHAGQNRVITGKSIGLHAFPAMLACLCCKQYSVCTQATTRSLQIPELHQDICSVSYGISARRKALHAPLDTAVSFTAHDSAERPAKAMMFKLRLTL